MTRLVLALVLVMSGTLAAGAQNAQDGRNPDIEGTIQSQIDAFQVDDFATAFTFASPNIRRLFGNSDNFGTMVRQGYPMVWRPAEVRFLELRREAELLMQRVMIRDVNGVYHVLEYQMIAAGDGWQINGVRLMSAPGAGA